MTDTTAELLTHGAQCSFISPLALAQADFIKRHYPQADETLLILLLMLQYKLEQGDVCLRLPTEHSVGGLQGVLSAWQSACKLQQLQLAKPRFEAQLAFCQRVDKFLAALKPSQLSAKLLKSGAVSLVTKDAETVPEHSTTPLILNRSRLYFRRYFLYECAAAARVQGRGALPYYAAQPELMRQALDILFAPPATGELNWQQAAAALAALQRFTIISGGPGTGKTTTVIRLLLLLLALDPKLRRIALCAPTGKAAARMAESIVHQLTAPDGTLTSAVAQLTALCGREEDVLGLIPQQAQTLHRLLKVRPHRVSIDFNADAPLPYDIVVVDEVSMVDLALFNKLLSAIAPTTILVLLGDKDQLCSVEAGSVLGDLASCLQFGSAFLSNSTAQALAFLCHTSVDKLRQGQLSDHALLLQISHRFAADSGIGRLAALVNELPPALAESTESQVGAALLQERQRLRQHKAAAIAALCAQCADLTYLRTPSDDASLKRFYADLIVDLIRRADGFAPFLQYLKAHDFALSAEQAAEAFRLLDNFRVLCSNRAGLTGDRNLNKLIAAEIQRQLQPPHEDSSDFAGRVVLVVRNDALLGLTNGDVGFEAYERLPDGSRGSTLRVFLPGGSAGTVHTISPLYIPDLESGFAMTVHKAQGSEYRHVLFCLSLHDNPVLTKELVYTAVTRAKAHLTIAGVGAGDELCADVLLSACMRLVQRESALSERIYGESFALH